MNQSLSIMDLNKNKRVAEDAKKDIQIEIKSRKKQVRFNLEPTIYIVPRPTEEELQQQQEERWEMWMESLKIGP